MSEEHEQRITTLIDGLIAKTKQQDTNKLKWTDTGDDRYELSLTKTTISIQSGDGDGNDPFIFEIADETGRVIERIDYDTYDYGRYSLNKLYETVFRSFTGIDEKITQLLSELGIAEPGAKPVKDDPWGAPSKSKEPPF